METYILVGICLVAWLITVGLFKLVMRDSEYAFIVGALAGLFVAAAAGGGYFQYLAACRTCL
ncbi:MAG: hypothetical protein H6983_17760 [Ectothiorhodospiraceae bacterium]|nr:hypothetical protein [Chromatiales bacterium]MCP5156023.1 hypothetical protein [Ectothiorhodospiraceae bacterium]